MTDNKNMLKTKNNRVEVKGVAKKKYYGIMEFTKKVRDEKGKEQSVTATAVVSLDEKMSRLQAKREISRQVKAMGGKLTYFGAVKNSK